MYVLQLNTLNNRNRNIHWEVFWKRGALEESFRENRSQSPWNLLVRYFAAKNKLHHKYFWRFLTYYSEKLPLIMELDVSQYRIDIVIIFNTSNDLFRKAK